jgi:pimeloyl-ACP methyl ester carboxylesterase
MRSHYRVVAIDARGHGDSSRPPRIEDYHWDNFTGDLIAVGDHVRNELGYARVTLGMGHSFGGTCTALAAAKRPDLYERILMVDPVLMPPPEMREAFMARRPPFSLAEMARKRRAVWPSRRAVLEAWSKAAHAFSSWDPRALEIYAEEGFRDREDGQVELKCATDVEAAVFENNASLDPFGFAPHIAAPTRILWGARGSFPRAAYEAFASRIPRAAIVDLDAGHLVTMERPGLVAEQALDFVR